MIFGLHIYSDWGLLPRKAKGAEPCWVKQLESISLVKPWRKGVSLGVKLKMKYNPLTQLIHTDLLSHHTGITSHLQTMKLHVRDSDMRNFTFWSDKFTLFGDVNLWLRCALASKNVHWNSTVFHKNVSIKQSGWLGLPCTGISLNSDC